MNPSKPIGARFSFIQKYHFRWVGIIAVMWTAIDLIYWVRITYISPAFNTSDTFELITTETILLRCLIVFSMSALMGYILIFKLRQVFRDLPLVINMLIKTGILLSASLVMNFLLHISYSLFIADMSVGEGLHRFFGHAKSIVWLLQHSIGWVLLFLFTQITIEINEKYSPGVFWDILIGKYIQPKVQKRIVMFMDLQDSTPIAEQLGSKKNFKFIRDFIFYVSVALLEYDGRIYQYVGDEIVVSWMYSPKNVRKCLDALAMSARLLQKNRHYFLACYGVMPEFKAGIHAGEITVGEIGIIKKDIAMSGDTMNTAARIRTACTTLEHKYIASKELLDGVIIRWPVVELGAVELKGKSENIELFALKI
jgi:adenylate cyclase